MNTAETQWWTALREHSIRKPASVLVVGPYDGGPCSLNTSECRCDFYISGT